LNYDDPDYVTKNLQVQKGLTLETVRWAFTSSFTGNWHPLTWISHMLDFQFYGFHAGGHHLTNALLHSANAVLLLLALLQLTNAFWRSAFVAALFAWHPLHVESVAWISERKDVLSTFFWLLALLCYIRYALQSSSQRPESSEATSFWKSRSAIFYGLTLVFFACGLMSKPMVVTLPFILLLLDYWPLGRFRSDTSKSAAATVFVLLKEKLPMLLLSLISAVVTLLTQRGAGAVASVEVLPLAARLQNAAVSYLRYLGKTVYPADLAVFYPYPSWWPIWLVIISSIFLIAASMIAIRSRRTRPHLAVGWFWFLGMLLPVIGLVQAGMQSMANRYTYVALTGIFIAMTWEIHDRMVVKSKRLVLGVVSAIALIACGWVTGTQLQNWRDSGTLFSYAIQSTTDNLIACNNLGSYLLTQERYLEAIPYFQQALQSKPRDKGALNLLGVALFKSGSNAQAVACFRKSLAQGESAEPHNNLGNMLALEGKLEEASREYQLALTQKPDYPEAHNNLANALALQGKRREAIDQYSEAVRLDPRYAEAEQNLGKALLAEGEVERSIEHLNKAIRLKPDYGEAYYNLGRALARAGTIPEAIEQFQTVLKLLPDQTDALRELALARASKGDFQIASTLLRRAIAALPDEPSLLNDLGIALAMQGKLDEAETYYAKALAISPGFAEAHFNYGNILLDQGRVQAAREHYLLALEYKPGYSEAQDQLRRLTNAPAAKKVN
jgi:tetratricopeptide (TPR) repeat protein